MSNFVKIFALIFKIFKNILLNRYSKYPDYVLDFEKRLADKFSCNYALTFANGTQAFEASLISLKLKKGSNILISKLSFTSTCITILKNGFKPIYADFDKDFKMILDDKILNNEISAVILTYVFGYTNEVQSINIIKKRNPNIKIISDCSHAHGASVDNKNIVNYTDISFMSLQGAKALSAGEGGIAFTNSKYYLNEMIKLSHPSRKLIDENNSYIDIPGFAKFGKSRIHPIGAMVADYNLNFLEKKNKSIQKKLSLIYSLLENNKNLYLPQISIKNTGGYHYGIPFFIKQNDDLKNFKKIPIKKYNYLKYENIKEFSNPELYDQFISSKNNLKFESSINNDIRDDLCFLELGWIKKTSFKNLKKQIKDFSNYLEN